MPEVWSQSMQLTDEQIQQEKDKIDSMGHFALARQYRFGGLGHPWFTVPVLYKHFMERFKSYGGMTPQISKAIGW